VLLNFVNVEHLSSAALGTLIAVSNHVKQKGGQLRLANIDPQILEVFVITKLNKLFQIHDTEAAAVQSFK
jgi:anti-sigma B factor antagonist